VLTQVKALGREISCPLLDNGFAGIAVLEYLSAQPPPALLACPGHAGRDTRPVPRAQEFPPDSSFPRAPGTGGHGRGQCLSGIPHGPAPPPAAAAGGVAGVHPAPLGLLTPLCPAGVSRWLRHGDELPVGGAGGRGDHHPESSVSLRAPCLRLCVAQCMDAFALALQPGPAPRAAWARPDAVAIHPLRCLHPADLGGSLWLSTTRYCSCRAPILRIWIY
jgi:hypothetical protein